MWCENQTSGDSLRAEVVGDDRCIGQANLRRELRGGRRTTGDLKWIADDFEVMARLMVRRMPVRSFCGTVAGRTPVSDPSDCLRIDGIGYADIAVATGERFEQ